MCVSTAPAQFTGTTLFLGKKQHPVHGSVFLLGYQNTAQNLSTGPNAMLLHFPAVGMTQNSFLDTRNCRHVLKDMVAALTPRERDISFGSTRGIGKGLVEIFDVDIYTVILATDVSLIPSVLPLIPARKRIAVNRPLFAFYAERFPGYAVALCCFDNKEALDAAPLLIWYKPMNPDFFLLPALDCHTGGVPDLNEDVEVDHWVILGSDELPAWASAAPQYRDTIPAEVAAFLPQCISGQHFSGKMRNGDFTLPARAMRDGNLARIERVGSPIHRAALP